MRVITPVQAIGSFSSRPARLLEHVSRLLGVEPEIERGGRGATRVDDFQRLAGLLRARVGDPSWCFHPAYFGRETHASVWIDAYDDWSLAPDLSRPTRILAARGYRQVRRGTEAALVTVNSRYMQMKLHPGPSLLVPNGVDRELAEVSTSGDDRARIIVMGHFFGGRTDWSLLNGILSSTAVDHVLVVGRHPKVDALVAEANRAGRDVEQRPATSFPDLAADIGPRTAFAVPHVVSDYTISQDLMKVYQAAALGLPVCVPNALWPSAVSRDLGYVFERGVSVDRVLAGVTRLTITPEQRRAFVEEHAWEERARVVAAALAGELP